MRYASKMFLKNVWPELLLQGLLLESHKCRMLLLEILDAVCQHLARKDLVFFELRH